MLVPLALPCRNRPSSAAVGVLEVVGSAPRGPDVSVVLTLVAAGAIALVPALPPAHTPLPLPAAAVSSATPSTGASTSGATGTINAAADESGTTEAADASAAVTAGEALGADDDEEGGAAPAMRRLGSGKTRRCVAQSSSARFDLMGCTCDVVALLTGYDRTRKDLVAHTSWMCRFGRALSVRGLISGTSRHLVVDALLWVGCGAGHRGGARGDEDEGGARGGKHRESREDVTGLTTHLHWCSAIDESVGPNRGAGGQPGVHRRRSSPQQRTAHNCKRVSCLIGHIWPLRHACLSTRAALGEMLLSSVLPFPATLRCAVPPGTAAWSPFAAASSCTPSMPFRAPWRATSLPRRPPAISLRPYMPPTAFPAPLAAVRPSPAGLVRVVLVHRTHLARSLVHGAHSSLAPYPVYSRHLPPLAPSLPAPDAIVTAVPPADPRMCFLSCLLRVPDTGIAGAGAGAGAAATPRGLSGKRGGAMTRWHLHAPLECAAPCPVALPLTEMEARCLNAARTAGDSHPPESQQQQQQQASGTDKSTMEGEVSRMEVESTQGITSDVEVSTLRAAPSTQMEGGAIQGSLHSGSGPGMTPLPSLPSDTELAVCNHPCSFFFFSLTFSQLSHGGLGDHGKSSKV